MTTKQLNEWYFSADFKVMERITKLCGYWFDEEDGCQEFVDVCDSWWRGLTKREKIDIYAEFY